MKNPLTPAGIEPATFRFVAQHLNHYATAVPISIEDATEIGRAGKEKLLASPLQVGSTSAAVSVLSEGTVIVGGVWCDEEG